MNKTIFLVEDDPSISDALSLNLEREGFSVTNFASAHSLMDTTQAVPDLFILDKQLSGIDGLDLCRYLKKQPETKNIPVIMLSANPHIMILAKDAGAQDALEKPFRMKDLRTLIINHIGPAIELVK